MAPARCWFVDVAQADLDGELLFLRKEIYGGQIDPLMRKVDAYHRFSERC